MQTIRYSLTNYSEIAQKIANQVGASGDGTSFSMPGEYGIGSIRHYSFEPFSIMITDFTFNQPIKVERIKSELEDFIDFGFVIKGISRAFDTEYQNNFNRMGFGAYISSPGTESRSIFDANTHHEQLFVLVNKSWLTGFLNLKMPQLLEKTDQEMLIYTPLQQQLIPVIYQMYNSGLNNVMLKNYIYSKCIELLTLFFFYFDESKYPSGFPEYHPQDLQLIVEIGAFLQNNVANNISIIELSNTFSINRDKMQKLFKAVHGSTIGEFHRDHRMAFAYNRIKEGHRVSEVGLQLGYSNLSHFARAFKKVHGVNPSELKSI